MKSTRKRYRLSLKYKNKYRNTKKYKGGNGKCPSFTGCSTPIRIQYPVGMVEEKELTQENTKNIPDLDFKKEPNTTYLLIMWDPDAPSPSFLHWMQLYTPSSINKVHAIQDLVSYQGPTPPSGIHRYYFTVYTMDNTTSNKIVAPSKRSPFNVTEFENMYSLTKVCERCMMVRAH
jgi:phosphatidylethanolamine-binding protein (PEBP) family uncharacterized protein